MRREIPAQWRAGFALLLFVGLLVPLGFGPLPARAAGEIAFSVTHAATDTTLVTANSDGHKPDTRVVSLPTRDEAGVAGRLDSILVTTAIDTPGPGDEVRIGHLVFSFGNDSDQIYVGGTAVYPAKGSTIKVASAVARPILGGSGKYAGASGWCATEHLADGSWRHTFHLTGGTTTP